MPSAGKAPDIASISVPDTLSALHVNPESGLTHVEVEARRKEHGTNEVAEQKGHPVLKFFGRFWGISAWMLELIMVLSAVLRKYSDLAMVGALLIVNAVLRMVHAGGAQARNLGCDGLSCSWGGVQTSSGIALRAGAPFLFFLMAEADLSGGAPFTDHYRMGLGGLSGAVLRWGRFAQTEAGGHYIYYLLGDRRRAPVVNLGQSFNFGPWAQLRLVAETTGTYREARAEVLGYF